MILYESRNLGYLLVTENSTATDYGIAITLDEEFGRTAFCEFAVAGMDMHTFHYTEGSKVQIVTRHLKIEILWHHLVLHIFLILQQIASGNRKLNIVHCRL